MKKRLIEYDLPLADISEASAHEKNVHIGLPAQFHIWWARRPLAASRATAFAALIDDPGPDNPQEREELQELIKRLTPWEVIRNGNSEDIEKAQQLILAQYGRPPRVLDPFSGGGSIPLEALRLGCDTYANDYNPVAVLIEKATIEWPQKFGIEVELPKELVHHRTPIRVELDTEMEDGDENENGSEIEQPTPVVPLIESTTQSSMWADTGMAWVNLLAHLVEKWANIILEETQIEIGRFYPEDEGGWIPVGYLWVRTIPCQNPACGAEIPLVKQFWLAKKKNKKVAYRPVVDKVNKRVDFELLDSEIALKAANFDPNISTVTRGDARCLVCGQVTKAADTRRLARIGKMGTRLVAVVTYRLSEKDLGSG